MWNVVQQTYFQPQFVHRWLGERNAQKSFEFFQVSFERFAADTPPFNTHDWIDVVNGGDLFDRANKKREKYERKPHFLSYLQFPLITFLLHVCK